MKIIKETKYLRFIDKEVNKKTKIIGVINISHDEELGEIKWYASWRQYCFFASYDTVWNDDCLLQIIEVMKELMKERKIITNFDDWKKELFAITLKETQCTNIKLNEESCREWFESGATPYQTFRETWNNENDCEI
jgi:hypothetical protein